jgi:hypothetical protein
MQTIRYYKLFVEGPDDEHVLRNLLECHEIPLWDRKEPKDEDRKVRVESKGGINSLMSVLKEYLKFRDIRRAQDGIGVVLDADEVLAGETSQEDEGDRLDRGVARRWQQVRDILLKTGYTEVPDIPDPSGTIVGLSQQDLPNVGIWLMPDNQQSGTLEDFITFLVPSIEQNVLWKATEDCLHKIPDQASLPGTEQRFRPKDYNKARIHTWLAWQREPGRPMGQAIAKRFLDVNAPHARTLVAWIRRLFSFDARD